MDSEFSDLSLQITKKIGKDEKKVFGIFITPGSMTSKLFESIDKHRTSLNIEIRSILEPSCGSCELVYACDKYFNKVKIQGVELNDTIYEAIKSLTFVNKTSLIHADFIKMDFHGNRYDLIVGNPPYCVCEKGYKLDESFQPYIVGRPNTFGLFLLKAINLLNDGGLLAFIISKSCLNAAYYAKIRNYVKATCHILEIIIFDGQSQFIDTEQATIGLILQKKGSEKSPKSKRAKPEDLLCNYSVLIGENYIFTPDSATLRSILSGATTLRQMGLGVRTGSVVWNQVKEMLTTDATETMLIYNTNITVEHTVEARTFSNAEKKQYIQGVEGKTDEVLVVNRGNGNSKYKLQYALIGGGGELTYLVENHLNEIYYEDGVANGSQLLASVVQSFKNPKTQLFIDFYLGNNGLSKTELETIFPIYL